MAAGRNYVRKGDPFTRMVLRGEGPPCVIRWLNRSTGRDYFTRVPVDRCHTLRARDVAGAVRDVREQLPSLEGVEVGKLAQLLALDWQPQARAVRLSLSDCPRELRAEVRVTLGVTGTGRPEARGARVWLTCPRCSRRCGVLYASPWGADGSRPAQPVTGCRVCLGLTDESRQSHKCLHWASAVIGQRTYQEGRRGWYQRRGHATHERAFRVYMASYGRAFRGLGIPMPGAE